MRLATCFMSGNGSIAFRVSPSANQIESNPHSSILLHGSPNLLAPCENPGRCTAEETKDSHRLAISNASLKAPLLDVDDRFILLLRNIPLGRGISLATWHGLKEGDEVEIEITGTSRLGDGVGRLDGCVIFVKGAKPGQKIRARITQLSARHARAELIKS